MVILGTLSIQLWCGKKGFEFQYVIPLDEWFSWTIAGRCSPIAFFLTGLMISTELIKNITELLHITSLFDVCLPVF